MIKSLGNINFSTRKIYLGIYLILECVFLQVVKVDRLGFWDVKVKNWINGLII